MAKKSAIFGEYVINVEDDGSIRVFRIYDNVKGSLREIAEEKNFAYDNGWTTQQFGVKIIKEFGDGKTATIGNYVVSKDDKNHIDTYRTYDNTKAALREISEKSGFEYDSKWNTRHFGSELVDFINNK